MPPINLLLLPVWIFILALISTPATSYITTRAMHKDFEHYDVVITGATPGGIMAAVAASRISRGTAKILLLERTANIGGLPANGLGATDISTKGATGGLFLEFVGRIKQHYIDKYGAHSRQVIDSNNGFHFEPKVAEAVLQGFLNEVKDHVTVLLGRQFDALPKWVHMKGGKLSAIRVLNRARCVNEWYRAKYFIDATYEGDLIAAARIPVFLGRESNTTYSELGAGVVYKYWNGKEEEGTTNQGDNAIQAFNYRLSVTNDPSKAYIVPKPHHYNRSEYVSLITDIITGCHAGIKGKGHCPRKPGNPNTRSRIPGQPNGMARLLNMVRVPNKKFDGNNQHLAFISTDLPEENWPYPTSSWAWRDAFAKRLRYYTLGLIYFAQNDPEVPLWFRQKIKHWGLSKDEYEDNHYFPRQVYVREGRRMHGEYIFTANDALPTGPGKRPPIHSSSVTSSHYALDSHAVRKREANRVNLDGFVSYRTPRPYTVPYGVMVPVRSAGVKNLLAPVAVSGSHIGFSTLRMEPCWMALGQAAGTAVALLLKHGGEGTVYDVNIEELQHSLLKQGAVLIYIRGWQRMKKEKRDQRQLELLREHEEVVPGKGEVHDSQWELLSEGASVLEIIQ